jgi:hypothetical protein
MEIGDKIYHIAQICVNGHVVSANLKSIKTKEGKYCEECGKQTITNCQVCKNPIQGWSYNPNVIMAVSFTPPNFCLSCGKAFPWMESKINAVQELIDLENSLTDDDKIMMKSSIDDVISETPKTSVAVVKFKIGVKKIE